MACDLITAGDRTVGVEQIGAKVRLSATSHISDLDVEAAEQLIAALLAATHEARQAQQSATTNPIWRL